MASNIGTTSGFTYANMKPAAGEEIDALWGQNIADNTGHIMARQMPYVNYTAGTYTTTTSAFTATQNNDYLTYVMAVNGHNRLRGTIRGDGTFGRTGAPDIYFSHGILYKGNLGTYYATTSGTSSNIGADYTFGSTFVFDIPIQTYSSVGSFGTLVYQVFGVSDDALGATRYINYTYQTPAKVYTTWDGL